MKNLLFFLSLSLILISCKNPNSKTEVKSDFQKKLQLVEKTQLVLELDEKSSFNNEAYTFNKSTKTNKYFYTFYNAADTTIVYYRLEDQKRYKIKLQSEGVDGIGPLGFGTPMPLMGSENEFYLYNPSNGYLFKLNADGKIVSKFQIYDFDNSTMPMPRLSGWNPMILFADAIYLSCGLGKPRTDYRNYGSVLRYDLKKQETSYVFPFPELYSQAFWGAAFKYTPNLILNSKKQQVLAGFPVTPSIYSSNLHGILIDSLQVSSKFIDKILPYSQDVKDQVNLKKRDFKRENRYSLSNSDYGELIYNENANLYYRRVYLRPPLAEQDEGKELSSFSIMVFDEGFNKLTEQKFSSKKYGQMIGVSSDGLLMARKDLYSENEDQLIFSVFSLE